MKLTDNSIDYALGQLGKIAGLRRDEMGKQKLLDLPVYYQKSGAVPPGPAIVIIPAVLERWNELRELPENSLEWLPQQQCLPVGSKLPFPGDLPVLFRGEGLPGKGGTEFCEERDDGKIIFNVDIIAATIFMLSRWEETVAEERDEHQRFPARASVAFRQNFLERPVVDEYALTLRAWLKYLRPEWRPETGRFRVKLSHDIDHVYLFETGSKAVRTILGDLLKRLDPGLAVRNFREWYRQLFSPARTEYLKAVYQLRKLVNDLDVDNVFNFKTSRRSDFDDGYDPGQTDVRNCIAWLLKDGADIGFHPGYYTYDDYTAFATEKERFDAVLPEPVNYGGRQHYLRCTPVSSWLDWETLGLLYDSTLGYAEYPGFRCGTCHRFKLFDLPGDRELDLYEEPLIIMDSTLFGYRQYDPEAAMEKVLELMRKCREVEGHFVMLWHNVSICQQRQLWADFYKEFVEKQLTKFLDSSDN